MVLNGPREVTDLEVRRLVRRAVDDPESFRKLYDMYIDHVYAFAYRRLGSRAEAEDATADTMLAALANLDRFAWKGGGFGAWLFRIARNRCLDALRDRRRELPLLADHAAETGSDGATPEEALISEEQHDRIRALVAGLPDPQQEAVLLKYSAGLSNKEIAEATGRTPTAVSSLLNRATSKLRRQWGEQHG
ncbi:MAG: sigma-70 family RNA polymerase sigma factor [Bacillota bacterium]|nr:sigma-70 family RNA polymerase sigma factor [Bacillota bacterium]